MDLKIFSVGQVNSYIKNIITQDYMLKNISIKGEISNCKYHSLGHIYFSLKDETGSLPAVMFKQDTAAGLGFKLEDGQAVIVSGRVGVYERDGRYQLYANKIILDGVGRLYEEFERLKMKLNEEGLFDCDLKKPIPKYPKRVGIVTAKTGAAIQDIINIARRRNPYVQLILCPAKVQGEGAADTIVSGIQRLDEMGLDTIIIGRGGGSIEDLWSFNEEKVVRAIYAAKTPIISGTGHEVDITLADYAADLRAPTPSAACELAIPDVMTAVNELKKLEQSIQAHMMNRVSIARYKLDALFTRLSALSPSARLEQQSQYLSDLYDKMKLSMDKKLSGKRHLLDVYTARLAGLSPMAKLVGGFGYIESEGNAVLSAEHVKAGQSLTITLHDGTIHARVEE
ncbi:MAG: exodeoxyribonuclease VII large subunit [Clostridium sp.]|nr:exodeoxyribonuclease VII large subunit [Clostridium sp.]MCM1399426.1 exodeoxyribonuclease VII large subunit [Clostridium sp.]